MEYANAVQLVHNLSPGQLWEGATASTREAWTSGNKAEAAGRALWIGLSTIVATEGLSRAGQAGAEGISAGRRLVVGGGRAAGFPETSGISLNVDARALPHVVGDIGKAPFRAGSVDTRDRTGRRSGAGKDLGPRDEGSSGSSA